MRKCSLLVSLLFLLLFFVCPSEYLHAASGMPKGAAKVSFSIKGMECADCPGILALTVHSLDGVFGITVLPESKTLQVIYFPDQISVKAIIKTIEESKDAKFKVLSTSG